jgi:peptidoglycan/xylan/chitin deacetylase (PgdA/CDA1 family)
MDDQGVDAEGRIMTEATAALASFDIPILMYHHLTVERQGLESSAFTITRSRFRSQLDYLRARRFTAITFGELVAAMRGAALLPPKPVLLTFDDGYSSFAEIAVPELVRRGMTATVFIVAGAIGEMNNWDADVGKPLVPLMDAKAIESVIAAGMKVEIHGFTHDDLRRLDDAQVLRDATRAREEVARRFAVKPIAFCYPFGRYEDRLFPLLARAGFDVGVSIFSEQRTVTEEPFAMRRIYIHQGDGALRFAIKLMPAYLRWAATRQRRLGDRCH